MTRNEQILSEVQKRFSSHDAHLVSKISTFIDGAKWADENPKSGIVNKEEFIDKACEIYRKHFIKFNPALEDFSTALDEAVNVFRKQLEA